VSSAAHGVVLSFFPEFSASVLVFGLTVLPYISSLGKLLLVVVALQGGFSGSGVTAVNGRFDPGRWEGMVVAGAGV